MKTTLLILLSVGLLGCATSRPSTSSTRCLADTGDERPKKYFSTNSGSGTHWNTEVAWSYEE